jgi:hypothetical protein
MAHLENDVLGTLGLQLRKIFMNCEYLCRAIAKRIKRRSTREYYSFYGDLFHDHLFQLMVKHGKAVLCSWYDIGVKELLSIVPDYLDFMSQMREKYGLNGKHELRENALDSARELLDLPSDLSEANEIPIVDIESFNPDMCALIATQSPMHAFISTSKKKEKVTLLSPFLSLFNIISHHK